MATTKSTTKKKQTTFEKLSSINVNKYVEKKAGLTYLSWAYAWAETKKHCPDARYEILYDELNDDEILLTGHTLSDKVETFFINLLRGTRVRGLKSIPKMTPRLRRPLLGISKDNLINYAKENNIEYLDDVTNFDNKIIRNWIRNELIPKVDEKFPGDIEEKISSLITEIESIFETTHTDFKYIKTAEKIII